MQLSHGILIFCSMRTCFRDTNWCQESATHDIQETFNTIGLSAGPYTILVQAAARGDNRWSHPITAQTSYELTAVHSHPPPPSLVWTIDGNGNSKTAFNPLDSIIWKGNNHEQHRQFADGMVCLVVERPKWFDRIVFGESEDWQRDQYLGASRCYSN